MKKLLVILLCSLINYCGGTEEGPSSSETINESQEQESQEQESQEQENGTFTNPFTDNDPNLADCLKRVFGEERYLELQNERPTPEEEQRIGECYGGPESGGQQPPGQGQQPPGQGQQPNNMNPFLDPDPMLVDCLKRVFGEERYLELQNERPTPEEEQMMSECYGAPGSGGLGSETQNDDEFCKLDPDAPQCGGEYLGYRLDMKLRGYTSGVCSYTAIVLEPPRLGVEANAGGVIADPSAVELSDGRIRLYIFAEGQGVRSAISNDGINFTDEPGIRVKEGDAGQPRVLLTEDGRYRLFTTRGKEIVSYLSDDGLDFSYEKKIIEASQLGLTSLSSPAIIKLPNSGYRMYVSDLPTPGGDVGGYKIVSAYSDDMLNWTPDPGIRIGKGSEYLDYSAEHPSPVFNPDGSIRLYFGHFPDQGENSLKAEIGMNKTLDGLHYSESEDGLTFKETVWTGFIFGNDPDVLTLSNGSKFVYFGDRDDTIGSYIKLGTCP